MNKRVKQILNVLLILLILSSLYFAGKTYYTIQNIQLNQNILGDMYEQYYANALIYSSSITSLILCGMVALMANNNLLMVSVSKNYTHIPLIIITYLLITVHGTLVIYLRFHSIESWYFFLSLSLTSLGIPIGILLAQIIGVIIKTLRQKITKKALS